MQNLFDLLNSYGIHINGNSNPVFLLALCCLIFTTIILISLINISIYIMSLYIVNNSQLLEKISSKYPYIKKIIKFYNSTRIGFILLELLLLFASIGYMISLCIRILIKLS